MSRTFRKNLRIGICTGDNREYYKIRRKKYKNKFKQNLRTLLRNKIIKEVSDLIMNPKYPKKDTWDEPTDGYWLISSKNTKIPKFLDEDFVKRKIIPNLRKFNKQKLSRNLEK